MKIFSTEKPDVCLSTVEPGVDAQTPSRSFAAIDHHPVHQAVFGGDAVFCSACQCHVRSWRARQSLYVRPDGFMLELKRLGDFDAEPALQNRLEFTRGVADSDLSAEDDRVQP